MTRPRPKLPSFLPPLVASRPSQRTTTPDRHGTNHPAAPVRPGQRPAALRETGLPPAARERARNSAGLAAPGTGGSASGFSRCGDGARAAGSGDANSAPRRVASRRAGRERKAHACRVGARRGKSGDEMAAAAAVLIWEWEGVGDSREERDTGQ